MKDNIEFIPNYVFEFNNNLENSKINNMISTPINDFINQIKCNPKLYFQPIFNEENQQIGKLLIILIKNQRRVNSSNSVDKCRIVNNQTKNMQKELIKNNNLDINLKKQKQELAFKNKQNENNNYELDYLRKDRKLPNQKNED